MISYAISRKKALERIFVFQAVELGYLTQEQLKECIKDHEKCAKPVPLLTICKERKCLTSSQVNHLMSRRLDASVARAFGEGLGYQKAETPEGVGDDEVEEKVVTRVQEDEREEYEKRLAQKDRLLQRDQKRQEFLSRKVKELENKLRNINQKFYQEQEKIKSDLDYYKDLGTGKEQEFNKLSSLLEEKDTFIKREAQKSKGLFKLLDQGNKELQEAEEKELKLNTELEKNKKEISFLQEKLDRESKEKEKLRDESIEIKNLIEDLEKELKDISNERDKLEQALKGGVQDNNVGALEAEKIRLERQSREQTRLIQKLQRQEHITTTQQLQKEKFQKEYQEKINKLQQENNSIKKEYEKEVKKREEEFYKQKITIESELSQYKQKNKNLEAKLERYQSSLGDISTKEAEQKAELQKQYEEEQETRKKIEEEKAQIEQKVQALESRISQFQTITTSDKLKEGTLLPGSRGEFYVIQDVLGQGGMGITYSALRGSDESKIVVKTLLPEAMTDMKVIMRFIQEAHTNMSFKHENLPEAYDLHQGKDITYFVMEYLEGETVEEILERESFIEPFKATQIIYGIAKALKYLEEQNLVHRDVKPANIILNPDEIPKLLDFGIVKMTERTCSLTTQGIILGTPYYLSPEQFGEPPSAKIDARSDIYSLGATFYHMVVGEVPFGGDNPIDVIQKRLTKVPKPGKVKSDLPRPICNIIEKMMNKNMKKRHKKSAELVKELETILKQLKG